MTYYGTDTSSTSFTYTVQTMISKVLMEELLPTLPHLMPELGAIKATFVKGTNGTMRYLRIPSIGANATDANIAGHTAGTAPWLAEGVAPTAQEFVFGYEEFTVYQAGGRFAVSDVAVMESPLELVSEAGKQCARQAAEIADSYVGQILAAGTNVLYAGTGNTARTDVGSTDAVDGSLLRRAAQTLKADSVPKFPDGTYRAVVHPGVVFDFEESEDIGGWLDVGRYNSGPIINGEFGKYAGIRFYESPSARYFAVGGAGGIDVYSTYICGPSSYALGDWGSITTHIVPFTAAPGNELAQSMSVGWKGWLGARLHDKTGDRYIRLESSMGL